MAWDLLKAFDGTTGEEVAEVIKIRQDAELNRLQEEAAHLAALDKMPGWQLIQQAMKYDIAKFQQQLIDSRNFDHTRQVQEAYKARVGLLNWITSRIAEGEALRQETTNQGPRS